MAALVALIMLVGLLPEVVFAHPQRAQAQARPDTPDQRSGSAAGRSHQVDAGATDAGRGREKNPKAAKGALPLEKGPGDLKLPEPKTPMGVVKELQETPPAVAKRLAEQLAATGQSSVPRGLVPGQSRELPERRRPNAEVFANPDGTETTRLYREPVHFQDDRGRWQKIDTSLVKTPEQRLRVKSAPNAVSFASRADDAVLGELPVGDGTLVRFGLADVEAAAPGKTDGSSVSYENVRGQADITLTAGDDGIKETITLASPEDPRVWHFPLHLQGLTPHLVEQGYVELRDAEGRAQAVIPKGWMADSDIDPRSGDGAMSDKVAYQLIEVQGVPVLKVTLDDEWLDDPKRVYPVKVDPSVTRLDTTGDTFVQHPYTANYVTDPTLKVGTFNGGTDRAASYLHWLNVDDTLQGQYIIDAKLGIYNIHSYSCTKRPVTVHPVLEPWSASQINTYPGPKYGTAIASKSFAHGNTECGSAPAWETIDLGTQGRDLVQQWADGGAHYGFTLRADVTDNHGWKKFASGNTSNKPYLEISHTWFGADYEVVGGMSAQPTNGQAGELNVKVTNLGAYTWYASGNDQFQLGVRLFDKATGNELNARAFTPLPGTVARKQSATVTARIPQAPPGEYYAVLDMYRPMHKRWASFSGTPVKSVLVRSVDVGPRVTDVQPRNNAQVTSLTPQLFMKTESVDNYPAGAEHQYQFTVCGGTPEAPVDCTTSPWGGNGWTVPEGKLKWSKTYFWYGTAREGSAEGTQTPAYHFTPEVEQPAITHHLAGSGPDGEDRDVDPKVGNYTRTETDAQVDAVGPPISVVRTYNSRDPRTDNAFGAGWSTRYDMRVVPDADGTGNVVITYPDGQQVRFGKNTDGTYESPKGRHATFVSLAGGGWKLADKAHNTYVFDASGRLTELADYRGHEQTLTYGTDGKLSKITAPGGRNLHFTWSGDHVTQVATDAPSDGAQPQVWTYHYSGDSLTEVCAPVDLAGSCTRYEYAVGTHFHTTTADANPRAYWRLGETEGTSAASQVLTSRGADDGKYHDVELGVPGSLSSAGDPGDKAARFNGTSSYVELPDRLVPENLAHFTLGLRFRTTGSGVLFSYDNRPADAEASADKYTPLLYVGTDGKLRGQFWNDSRAPITSGAPVNDGAWHQAVIVAAGAVQTLYLDGAKVGTLAGNIRGYDQKYVHLGAGTWQNWPATSGEKGFFAGDIDEVAVYDRPLGTPAVNALFTAGRPTERLTKATLPSGRVDATVSYDSVTERVGYYTTSDGGGWKLSPPVLDPSGGDDATATVTVTDPKQRTASYTYDLLYGSRVVAQRDAGGATVAYAYDEGGFLAQITDENGNVTRLGHDERGNQISRTTCRAAGDCQITYYAYHHDPDDPLDPRNDQLIAERDPRSSGETDDRYATTYAYTATGELKSVTTPPVAGHPDGRTTTHTYTDGTEPAVGGGTAPAGLLKTTTDPAARTTTRSYTAAGDLAQVVQPSGLVINYAYDRLGRRTSETKVGQEHPNGLAVSYTYDQVSRVVTETHPEITNAVTGGKHRAEVRYTYDADGNTLTESVHDLADPAEPARITSWTYNDSGQVASETTPEGGTETYGWDEFGNRVRRTDARSTEFLYAYSPRGELTEVTLKGYTGGTDPPQTARDVVLDSYAYDPAGRLANHTDAMGRTTRYRYFDDGELADKTLAGFREADGGTRDIELENNTYDAAGNLTRQVTGGGKVRTDYEVDADGRIVAMVLDPEGLARRTELTMDAADNVVTEERSAPGSTRTEVVDYAYDVDDNLIRQAVKRDASAELVSTWTYDQFGNPTSEVTPRGNTASRDAADYTTSFTYDEAGNLVKTTLPPVKVTERTAAPVVQQPEIVQGYNAFGDATHIKDERGHVAVTAFDKDGQVVQTTAPSYTRPGGSALNSVMRYVYDQAGNLVSQTDPLGRKTTFTYDQLGNLIKTVLPEPDEDADAPVVRHGYTLLGERLWSQGPTGERTEATYDDLGRQITLTQIERKPTAAAHTTGYDYSDAGWLSRVHAPGGGTTTFWYNAAGEPTRVTDPLGRYTRYRYDRSGRTTEVIDPMGRVSSTYYDLAGRPTHFTDKDADGQVLRTRQQWWDADGNPTQTTDSYGRVTHRSFDALGRLTWMREPISDAEDIDTNFGYDAAGNRTRLIDGRGNITNYTYNSWDLLESVIEPATTAHPAAADRTYTLTYDAAGRPDEQRLPGGVTRTRTFDGLDRLTTESGTGPGTPAASKNFGYDLAGRLTSAGAPGGTNHYTWDDRGNLLQTTGPSGNASFAYDARSRLIERTDKAGTTAFTWDQADQLTSVADPLTGQSLTYGYNDAGQPTTVSYGAGRGLREYGYDPFGRLTSDRIKAPDGSVTASIGYEYDTEDRLISKNTTGTAGAGTSTYTYDYAGRLTSWTAPNGQLVPYRWDAAGNRIQAGDATATYDERNRILTAGTSTYAWTTRGTLATRTSGGQTSTYTFDALDRLTSDGTTSFGYDALDRMVTRGQTPVVYAGLDNNPVSTGQADYTRDPAGEPLSVAQGGTAAAILTDLHTDAVATFDPATGQPASSTSFDPFGQPAATTGTTISLGFQGEFTDPNTGLVNMHARWYAPELGGFISRDEYLLEPEPSVAANRYGYGNADPLNHIDPTGHFWKKVKKYTHKALDAASYIPGPIGTGASLANAGLYATSGDWRNAGWALAGAVPGGKALSKGLRMARAASKARKASKAAGKARKTSRAAKTSRAKTAKSAARRKTPPRRSATHKTGRAGSGSRKSVRSGGGRARGSSGKAARGGSRSGSGAKRASAPPRPSPAEIVRKRALTPAPRPPLTKPASNPRAVADRIRDTFDTAAVVVDAVSDGVDLAVEFGLLPEDLGEDIQSITTPLSIGLGAAGGLRRPSAGRAGTPDLPTSLPGGSCSLPGRRHSFLPGTPVLMADGSTKPIEKVKAGDKVLAAEPNTGKTRTQQVTGTLTSKGTKHLVTITVDTDGAKGTQTGTLTATDNHPFWLPREHRWAEAGELKPGTWLRTSTGTWVQVTAIKAWTAHAQRVHNLTVTGDHTYHVEAGTVPLLVHNCGYEAEALAAQRRAQSLKDMWTESTGYNGGTVAVIGVRNLDTGEIVNRVAINGNRRMPKFILGSGEEWMRGRGHAEETVFRGLADNEEVLYGGTSRNVCKKTCLPYVKIWGMRLGGTVFRGMEDKTAHRAFWRTWRYQEEKEW